MNHRERVLAAIRHQAPDRCPLEMSFTPEFAGRLAAHLFGTGGGGHNPHGGGNDYQIERRLGLDILLTSVGWANSYYAGARYNPGADTYTDEWGIGWENVRYHTRFGPGHYTEVCGHPLADDAAIERYQAPDPDRESLYTPTLQTVRDFGKTHFIVGSCQTTILETAIALRGMERMLMDLCEDEELSGRILDIPEQYHTRVCRQLAALGVDMIWLGDDLGAQHRMLLDPNLWRRLLKPRLARLIQSIRAVNPGIFIAYHTDGHVRPIVPDLIEVGVDVLHPIQPACMDLLELKHSFGDRLCFMGSVDVQNTLPFGSVADVRRETEQRIRKLGAHGGLILAPTHHVQQDTPVENVLAMIETAQSIRLGDS